MPCIVDPDQAGVSLEVGNEPRSEPIAGLNLSAWGTHCRHLLACPSLSRAAQGLHDCHIQNHWQVKKRYELLCKPLARTSHSVSRTRRDETALARRQQSERHPHGMKRSNGATYPRGTMLVQTHRKLDCCPTTCNLSSSRPLESEGAPEVHQQR
jgi:hypothetical protein